MNKAMWSVGTRLVLRQFEVSPWSIVQGSRGLIALETSPKSINREGLGESRAEVLQGG